MSNEHQILFEYLDELLRVQSKAAEMFEHKGVLGTVRENFLAQQIKERIDNPLIHTGQIVSNGRNVGQSDLLIRRRGTINPEVGGQVRLPASDCTAVVEVKSNAKGTDFTRFDQKAALIKEENENVLCGIFTYRLECRKSTILKRFGIGYDMEYLEFEPDDRHELVYPNIDFVMCIDDSLELVFRDNEEFTYNKFFFITKNNTPGLEAYQLALKPPFSNYFLSKIGSACA